MHEIKSDAKVNSSITATPKPDVVASSRQTLENTVASVKKECDEDTVGSINHDEEIHDNVTAAAIKKEDDEQINEVVDRCKWVRIKQEDTDDEQEGSVGGGIILIYRYISLSSLSE